MKKKFDYKQLCNIICILLALVMLVMMFTRFWVVPEKEIDASMVDYLWMTWKEKDLEKQMKDWVGGKDNYLMNNYIATLFFGFVPAALAVIVGIIKRKSLWAPIMGFLAGGWMVWGLATQAVFKYGVNYTTQLAIAIAVLVASLGTIVLKLLLKMVENHKKNEKYRQFNKAMKAQQ